MKKFKIAPNSGVVSAETLKTKFDRLAQNIGENGLTPNFQYVIITGAYGIKAGVNPQTNKPVEYPIIKSVKIGAKSGKIGGIAELSVNSLKRTVNIEDTTADVVDFSAIVPNCSELNALQLLETLPEDKVFAVVPNGTLSSSTNFDANVRPRQIYKIVEITDATTVTNVTKTAKEAGLVE